MENLKLVESWDKTFPKSDKVDHKKVWNYSCRRYV